jgi:3-isopropylmalate/(R)-2-methylmalate dehydratase small subunit
MSEFSLIDGVAAPLPIANLDTDQIMPKQFLLGIDKSGLAKGLLYNLRFDPDGTVRPDFILNTEAYAKTRILVGGPNFGCGSSREHAVWGLQQGGIGAVLAPSFGEIFYYNALNNRLLPIVLEPAQIDAIIAEISHPASNRLTIDVDRGTVQTASGRSFTFQMQARQRQMYLEGLDALGATLKLLPDIEQFEQAHWAAQPWTRVLPLEPAS